MQIKNRPGRLCSREQAIKWGVGLLSMVMGSATTLVPSLKAEPIHHNIAAANITVVQNGPWSDNTSNSITATVSLSINDFRTRPTANRGDIDVQVGDDPLDDVNNGIIISSVAQHGTDCLHTTYTGTNFCTSHIDDNVDGFFIPLAMTLPNSTATTIIEWNANVSAAWFPYSDWIAGYARSTTANGGAHDILTASAGLVLGTHYIDHGGGQATVDLTSLGIDSRTDGILLVMGAKNEDNYGLSQVNETNGTWQLYSKDNGTDGANTEQDPFAFVYIPKTNNTVISGRFLGDATIVMHSGVTPQFTVANIGTGTYELKIPGRTPANGVLILSPEGGLTQNRDNILTYEPNTAGDGWIIQTRDLPNRIPPLETPGLEPVASFVYVPAPIPQFTVTPNTGLVTSESGGETSFTVVLDAPPTSDVTIDVSSSDTSEGTVSTSSLTFTPSDWNIPQTVTVTGQDDALTDGSVSYTIVLAPAVSGDSSYNGIDPVDVSVLNTDNEGGITVAPTSGLVTTEAGGTATFTIRLNTQPAANVTVGFSSGDASEGTVSPSSVTLTPSNWDQEQTITVTGVDDLIDDGTVTYTIITGNSSSLDGTYNNVNPADVTVMNTDDDIAGVTVSATSPNWPTLVEGGSTNYNIVLNTEPTANVTVTVASSDTAQGGSPASGSLTFTPSNWSTPQTVTVIGADDSVPDGNTVFVVSNTFTSTDAVYGALSPIEVTVTTLDNEAVLTPSAGDTVYAVGAPGVGIDGRLSISDPYSPNYLGGTLTVAITSNGTADDRLEIRNDGTNPGQISVAGNVVSYGGVAIATFTGGSGTSPLVVTFTSAAATPVAGEAVLRAVTFRNVNSNPSKARREISITLVDGDGGTSTTTKAIQVGYIRMTSFQQGVDHGYGVYSGAADIHLRQADPAIAFPTGNANGLIFIDFPAPGGYASHGLLRFDDLFGTNAWQIPSNAIIVSAELVLTINDTGHGSPFYRMLRPWDANNETWDSMGEGVQTDWSDASGSYDSQLGVELATLSGVGRVSVAVTPDINAWRTNEVNYGWAMPGWLGQNNGIGFAASEVPNADDRPMLRVKWLPPGATEASFHQDVNGYVSAHDTRIRATEPDLEFSTAPTGAVDFHVTAGVGDNEQILLRFDDVVGTGPGQVPPNSLIYAAVLDLASTPDDAIGDGGQFFPMLQSWDATSTWNSLINGIQTDGVEASATATAVAGYTNLAPNVQGGFHSFELTPDVQAWVNGSRANHGWAILPWPNGGDGWGMGLAESPVERDRPQLRVFYGPVVVVDDITLLAPVVGPSSVEIKFTGNIGTTYSVLRAADVAGSYTVIGTATVQPNGVATFTDNSPLSSGAFYRVSNP